MRARDRRPALRKIPPFNSAILRLHLPLGMVKENWMRIRNCFQLFVKEIMGWARRWRRAEQGGIGFE